MIKSRKWLPYTLGTLAILGVIGITSQLGAPRIGRLDFRAYWSAAYLLAHLQNFADPDLLLAVQQNLAGSNKGWAMMTWNLPWMLTLFIPYTLFDFSQAAWLWMFTNILLIFVGAIWFWQTLSMSADKPQSGGLLAVLLAFIFAPTIFVMLAGQVGSLVFFGLAGFLYFYQQQLDGRAGILLTCTLIKPHIVYLVLPLILLHLWQQKRWQAIGGLVGTSAGLFLITTILWPTFLVDYWRLMLDASQNRLLNWENATLGGMTATFGLGHGLKYVGFILLPFVLWWWWRYGHQLGMITLVLIILPISLVTAPFGWAYDQIVLLLPVLQIIYWQWTKELTKWLTVLIVGVLFAANGLAFYLRWITVSDSYYIYYPIVIATIFYGLFWHVRVREK